MGLLLVISVAVCVGLLSGLIYGTLKILRAKKLMKNLTIVGGHANTKIWSGGSFEILKQVVKHIEERNMPAMTWMGTIPYIVLHNDTEDIKNLTHSYGHKPYMYRFSLNLLGDGLLTARYDKWRLTSKHLVGVFNANMVDGYQEIFSAYAQKLVDCVKEEEEEGKLFDVNKYLTVVTLETIYNVSLGVPSTAHCGVTEKFHTYLRRSFIMYLRRTNKFFYHFNFLYRWTNDYKVLTECEKYINETITKIIDIKLKERNEMLELNNNENKTGNSNTGHYGEKSFKSYLDVLLGLNSKDPLFSLKQVHDELATILAAGHETVSQALQYGLLLLGSNRRAQDALYAELIEVLGDSNRPITKDDLDRMPYCEAVVNEALRLYPTVPLCFRYATRDLKLKEFTVPKGSLCGINIWLNGRSKKTWGEDAEEFRPERWLDNSPKPFFMPFSTGKHACIGKRYSIAVMKTFIGKFIQNFEIHSDISDMTLKMVVTLQPKTGNLVKVYSRV